MDMNKQKENGLADCYQLLRNVLLDAFNVETLYFTPPYQDIRSIDQGLRAAVWTNYDEQSTHFSFATPHSRQYQILIIKSNLGFYNVMVFFDSDPMPDFIAIGPFRNDKLSPTYFTDILKEAHISPATIQGMKYIYESMPFAQLDAVVNVTKHILSAYVPEFTEITPELIQYSEQKRAVEVNTDVLNQNLIKFAEQYYELLSVFLKFLKSGDNTNARIALQTFLRETKLTANKNMRGYKMILQNLNSYCHMTLLQAAIHPSHVLRQSLSFEIKIENTTAPTKLEQLPNEICHKYCLLVKNYAHPDYSRLTRDVIAYIRLHLEEELSLNRLASHFQKNPSVLSNIISKDTGQTVTQFIQQLRTQEAIRLFNTTNMSVSEVAMAVGYQDFSYFSKVFSKNVGCSPRRYRQQSLSDEA